MSDAVKNEEKSNHKRRPDDLWVTDYANCKFRNVFKEKINVLKDFGVTVTPSIKNELYKAKTRAELDRIARRYIDKVLDQHIRSYK